MMVVMKIIFVVAVERVGTGVVLLDVWNVRHGCEELWMVGLVLWC